MAKGSMRSGTLNIIAYHGILGASLEVEDWCFLHEPEFRRQMRVLKAYFEVVPLSEGLDRLRAGDFRRPAVAVTFDDGFLNNFTVAFPVLREESIPATIFLATGFVGTRGTVWFCKLLHALSHTSTSVLSWRGHRFDLTTKLGPVEASRLIQDGLKRLPQPALTVELRQILNQLGHSLGAPVDSSSPFRMLGAPELSEMLASGLIELGAHTHTHAILSLIPPADQEREITQSLNRVRELTGGPCTTFAYPNGADDDYDEETIRILERHGVRAAVTTSKGPNDATTPPMALKRYSIGSGAAAEDLLHLMHDNDVFRNRRPFAAGWGTPAGDKQRRRLVHDWTIVTPQEVRASVEQWSFHLETVKQFQQCPTIDPRDTAYFAGVKEYRRRGGQLWAECTTDEAIIARVEAFRRLYERIRTHGYRMTKPITVNIARDGSIRVYDGHHRAAIALALGINISAKVRCRHADWIAQVMPIPEEA
jgi:peptidoglycan/xylan/chitin deacetylase (PgdA/CDA1 family)